MVQFVTTWLRTTRPNQRCRVVLTGNPPSSQEGQWILEDYAPWLDRTFHDPAKPGELRWFVRDPADPSRIRWTKTSDPVKDEKTGKTIRPLSRTFIPALLKDNPRLGDDYYARLNAQPEPLRSQMLYGDFSIGLQDNAWQVIPTELGASSTQLDGEPMTRGARGRSKRSELIPPAEADARPCWLRGTARGSRPLIKHPGAATPDGGRVLQLILLAARTAGVVLRSTWTSLASGARPSTAPRWRGSQIC